MNKPTRRRRTACRATARTLAIATAVAALIAILGAGQALAGPDERVLEHQGRIDRHETAGQADEQGKAAESTQAPSAQIPRRHFKPEPPVAYGPPLDSDEPLFPAPAPPVPANNRAGLAVTLAVVALLLAVGAAATWRIRHHHARPGPTA
jgi:hypothetical protein